ncbi:MAG: AraC family transcriptional regulator [Clostridiales bacterium]|nr:AraC family transcriptional regulator [Clostridiales bacterium]
MTVGYVEEGSVCIIIDGECSICEAGDGFTIPPNILHEIKPVDDNLYSMMVLCIKTETPTEDKLLTDLQDTILDRPENSYLIEEMAQDAGISTYHLIRQFKKAFGLTPHQFQIQSKVRKAQKLLEEGKSLSDVTFEAGFCDQSHMVRCFQKIVGMTPKQYQDAVIGRNNL